MQYSNVNFNVIYVDPSIEEAGDGTTPATALSDLPQTITEFEDNSCFIIRRTSEDYAVNLISGSSTILNILFLGMPNASDLMYDFVPEEAKTAWGDDEAVYANMQSTQSSYFALPSLNHFMLHRIYLFRNGNTISNYIFYFYNSSSYVSCISIEHCKFGYKGIDLDSSEYTSDSITSNYLKGYLYTRCTKMLSIKDVIMNFASNSSSSLQGIYCYFAHILNVEDVQIYSLVGTHSSSYYPLYLSDLNSEDGIECNIYNVKETIRFNGTATYMPTLLFLQGYISVNIKNITIEFGEELNSTRPTELYLAHTTMYLAYMREYNIKNIDVNIPYCWRISSTSANILRMYRCYTGGYVPGVEKELSNINIIMGDDEDVAIGTSNSYTEAANTSSSYVAAYLEFSYDDCENFFKVPIIDNINISHPRGRSLYIYNARLTNATLKGAMTSYYTLADIDLLESYYPGYTIYAYEGCSIRIKEVKVNLENPTNPYAQEPIIGTTYTSLANIFVDESNAPLIANTLATADTGKIYQGFTCNNEGEDGHFVQRTPNGICDTWSIYREGGSTAALKIYNNSYNSSRTMVLGRKPFKGIQLTPTTTGRHILKAYIAHKGYIADSDMYSKFYISATIKSDDGDKTFYSSINGRWLDDTDSEWVNDSDLTQKCLEMPLDLPNSEVVDVRFYFAWYGVSGFIYVDPAIELIKEEESESEEEV